MLLIQQTTRKMPNVALGVVGMHKSMRNIIYQAYQKDFVGVVVVVPWAILDAPIGRQASIRLKCGF